VSARVYLDNAASTPLDVAAAARAQAVAANAGNPSAIHAAGVEATREVERARIRVARALGASPEGVIFTSGATEANNLALKGVAFGRSERVHLVVSAVEHPAVLEPARWLADIGRARLTVLEVTPDGVIRLDALDSALNDAEPTLVSVQQANNETGVLQSIAEIVASCRRRGALLHVDASQGFCKAPLDVDGLGVDLVTASGHKLHGPKGVGFLYARPGLALVPLFHGGGHESGARGGTLNAPAIAGFGEAIRGYTAAELARVAALQARFEAGLRAWQPQVRIHGASVPRIPTITNFAIPGRSGKATMLELDRRGICVSASSACHSTRLTPSPVLTAMGLTPGEADEAVRVSFGRTTTPDYVDALLRALTELHGRTLA